MPPRKKPSKEEIKAKADRAEGKTPKGRKKANPLDPPTSEEAEELEEMPGGVFLPPRKGKSTGRPTKYKPEYATIAKAMLRKGATVAEIAGLFEVTVSTIYLWQQTHEAFSEAFSELGAAYDGRIERTLAERAMGYTYDAVKIFNNKGMPVVVPYREHVPPDVGAIKHWLAVRQPETWRVREEVEVSSNGEAFLTLWKQLNSGKKVEGKSPANLDKGDDND